MKKLILLLLVLFVVSCTSDPIIYTLTTSTNPADGGSISPSTSDYESGEIVNIIASPNSKYVFDSWSGASGLSKNTTVTMSSDKVVVANFTKKKFSLTINVEGEGTVSEKIIKAGTATDYTIDSVIELTAVPRPFRYKERAHGGGRRVFPCRGVLCAFTRPDQDDSRRAWPLEGRFS